MSDIREVRLKTRQEIIDIWEYQSDDLLGTFCCPNCRDLLANYSDHHICVNHGCNLFNIKLKNASE